MTRLVMLRLGVGVVKITIVWERADGFAHATRNSDLKDEFVGPKKSLNGSRMQSHDTPGGQKVKRRRNRVTKFSITTNANDGIMFFLLFRAFLYLRVRKMQRRKIQSVERGYLVDMGPTIVDVFAAQGENFFLTRCG